jgi:hypothetical protein
VWNNAGDIAFVLDAGGQTVDVRAYAEDETRR